MKSKNNGLLTADKWFEQLPHDNDRNAVTGIIAMANAFDFVKKGSYYPGYRDSVKLGYLAVYAIGSRVEGRKTNISDVDILVAHNLRYETGAHKGPDFGRAVDQNADNITYQKQLSSATNRAYSFNTTCLNNDPVACLTARGIAASSVNYRLPSSFDGNLPCDYRIGGIGHKSMVRYNGGVDMTALDVVFYRGIHHADNPFCARICDKFGWDEGENQEIFETIIDTDNNGEQLPRTPLFTLNPASRKIYIESIRKQIEEENKQLTGRDSWNFIPSWAKEPICL